MTIQGLDLSWSAEILWSFVNECWEKLGEAALLQGYHQVAEICYQRIKKFRQAVLPLPDHWELGQAEEDCLDKKGFQWTHLTAASTPPSPWTMCWPAWGLRMLPEILRWKNLLSTPLVTIIVSPPEIISPKDAICG